MFGFNQGIQPTNYLLEDVLKKVSEEEIFGIFIKEPINLDNRYRAPYRKDDNPDCYFKYYDDKLLFTDFASGDSIPTMTCIGMVMKCLNLTYKEAIDYVVNYFNLESVIIPHSTLDTTLKDSIKPTSYPIKIEISKRDFNLKDKNFWYKYGITRENLIEDKVFPITAYKSNSIKTGKSYIINTTDISYAFIDFQSGNIKIYRPYNKEYKWFTNCNQNDIGSINFMRDTSQLVITKSYKDCRVLRNLGVNSIWFQNEGMSPSSYILKNLTERFSQIVMFYDNDPAGIAAGIKIKNLLNSFKPNISQEIFLPPILYRSEGIKDPSDFIVKKGKEELINFIKSKNIKMYESS